MIKIGDLVGRKSYGCDVLFRVIGLSQGETSVAELHAVYLRLVATAPLDDLVKIEPTGETRYSHEQDDLKRRRIESVRKRLSRQRERIMRGTYAQSVEVLGVVLHLDGDPYYVKECELFYRSLGVNAICKYVPEDRQAREVVALIEQYHPAIVVLTGHDGKLKNKGTGKDTLGLYHNSRAFVDAVKRIRERWWSLDVTPVVAGACQSYYEALIESGANYASSPGRILIDIFDPCIVACLLASLNTRECLQPAAAVQETQGKALGFGGLETRGQMRVLYPPMKEGGTQ